MFDTKFRRIVTAIALTTACSLLPLSDLQAGQARSRRLPAVEKATFSLWSLLSSFWGKASVRIDDNGNKASVRIDDNGARVTVFQENRPAVRLDGGSREERN
jgi:hypothetical protein